VLQSAVELADRNGIEALTMRNLAQELGVEAMSLYYHVANKDAILDGITEQVVEEINQAVAEVPPPGDPDEWNRVLREMILLARQVMLRHRWAPGVMETRTNLSPALLQYFESVLATMRAGGFSYDLAHHALHALGSRALGFAQELFQPDDVEAGDQDDVELMESMAAQLPNLVGMMMEIAHDDPDTTLGWCDDQAEFEFGLDLLLDGLDRHR
jgi:AcrR family transcriptional regulator